MRKDTTASPEPLMRIIKLNPVIRLNALVHFLIPPMVLSRIPLRLNDVPLTLQNLLSLLPIGMALQSVYAPLLEVLLLIKEIKLNSISVILQEPLSLLPVIQRRKTFRNRIPNFISFLFRR